MEIQKWEMYCGDCKKVMDFTRPGIAGMPWICSDTKRPNGHVSKGCGARGEA